jgi:predicted acylesterase/phospholipase RssA
MGPPQPRADTCDLIMKGGIASGIAYPAAVLAMKDRYRFVNIGGASAGAIAAAATAAAEYARDNAAAEDGFTRLNEMRLAIQQRDLLPQLFQPTRQARTVIGLLFALQSKGGLARRILAAMRPLVRWVWLPVGIQVAVAFGLSAVVVADAGGALSSLGPVGIVALGGLLTVAAAASLAAAITVRAARLISKHLPSSYFGMCLGKTVAGSRYPALTDWLHGQIQHISGARTAPLTFADLAERDVHLTVMTTDLTRARPVRLPYEGDDYWFALTELAALFPPDVVEYLAATCNETRPADSYVPELRRLPGDRLPIIVAARMSSSFPGLLAAVPLWTTANGKPVRHWLSDGGISSNFPIHLFDAWVPTRPTFGLNLVPAAMMEQEPDTSDEAVRGHHDETPPVRRATIRHTIDFVGQILDTMQNWRDTMQSELFQFRDRVTDIVLSPKEGGSNIAMPSEVIARIDAKGRHAGQTFTRFDWPSHLLHRYAWLMQTLQRNLRHQPPGKPAGLSDALSPEFQQWLAEGTPGVERPLDRPSNWFAPAAAATTRLLQDADRWLGSTDLSFDVGGVDRPASVMRILPDV